MADIDVVMNRCDRDVGQFLSVTAPCMANHQVKPEADAMILGLRHLRMKMLDEPNGRKILRPQIDRISMHIYNLKQLLDLRVLDHPPACKEHLRQAGLIE